MNRAKARKQARSAAHASREDHRRPAGAEKLNVIRKRAREERRKARRAEQ